MITGHAIIGANFGDEGKGLMTDFFASRDPESTIVVRFNGGAQAGHTVSCPDGRRHVFSHFGSGTLVDAPTLLSQFFLVNPVVYRKERDLLGKMNLQPLVFVDERALITTPFDMFINQVVETKRGSSRHGSCGLGINETVTRSFASPATIIHAGDLADRSVLAHKLELLASTWLDQRLQQHHVDLSSMEVVRFKENQSAIIERFIADCRWFLDSTTLCNRCPERLTVLFEGAQGLLLDEDRLDQWPHVTRSKTGLVNVLFLARRLGLERLRVTYVSRTYLTRHGAGPLAGECDWSFTDRTNMPNAFQGSLRFAPLDQRMLRRSIEMDFQYARLTYPDLQGEIAFTCADQLPMQTVEQDLPVRFISYGRTRDDVQVEKRVPASRALVRV